MSATEAPRILVTRPAAQAERTAARLRALGYAPVLAPMLRIEPVPGVAPPEESRFQAALVTSAAGIEAYAALTPSRALPLLTVGDRTAATARALGFDAIRSAGGTAEDLLALARTLDPAQGALLHIRGEDIAASCAPLSASGFDLHEIITYRAVLTPHLPPEALAPPPVAALVYSPRTAEALADALSKTSLDSSSLTLIGISEKALAPLSATGTSRVTASAPTEPALLATLQATIKI